MNRSNLTLAIDMDETIANTLLVQRRWLEERFGYSWQETHGMATALYESVSPDHMDALTTEMDNGVFFRDIPLIEGCQAAIERLNLRYDVYITSAAMEFPSSLRAKYEWLLENFPFINPLRFVFCGSKNIINADVMIDDSPRHFEHFRGRGIVFSAPHNRLEKRYPRLTFWDEAEALVGSVAESLMEPLA